MSHLLGIICPPEVPVPLARVHVVELPHVHVAHVNALPDLSVGGILHFKLKKNDYIFCLLLGEIVFIAHKRHHGLVNPVVGEGGPAVVHHAAVVVLLAVGVDHALVELEEIEAVVPVFKKYIFKDF